MKPAITLRIAAAALLPFIFPGCLGYHVGPVKPAFMAGIKTIAVPTVRNDTLIPRVEVLISDTIVRQFQEDGTFKVASSDQTADAVLEVTLINMQRRPSRSVLGDVQATEEFDMTLTLHYRVFRKANGEVIDDKTTQGTTSFFVSGDVNQDERQAIPLAAQSAAQHIVTELSEGW